MLAGARGRYVGAGVVARLVSRKREQTDEGHADRHHQDGPGPAHDGRPNAPPAPGAHRASGLEQTEMAPDAQHRRRQGQRRNNCDEDADPSGNAKAVEIREPGEGQTEHRTGNRQARTQDDVRGPSVHRLEGRYPILSGLARFVVAAQDEDRIIGSGRDDQQRQQVGRVRGQLDDSRVRQHGNDSAGRGQLDHHREDHENHRGDTTVEREQHQRDHPDGDQGGLQGAVPAHLELIGDQGRGAGDVGLHPRRRRRLVHDIAYRVDRLIGQ